MAMKKTIGIIVSIVLLVALIVGAAIYHNHTLDNAYNKGNSEGYNNGHSIGYDAGYDAGYDVGHDDGYEEGNRTYKKIKNEYRFYRNNIVLVTTTGKKYHRYECHHINDRTIYIYEIDDAKAKGYTSCLDCF